ncbi:MAG TPA: radical SAM protein [Ruminococcaceae bacterium]|nr:radical SAM protein [Oscillospiraceae bacterium]
MAVIVNGVEKGSPAYRLRIKPGDTLLTLNGEEITDVLDYRFYQNADKLCVEFINAKGKIKKKTVRKAEDEEFGLVFDTYLIDKKRSCRNKCIFCFIDQLPKGMRESLYFKDDDSRLSFLFGNYITLTNLTEHEVERIIKMHISPINISVHTTNPELRVKMMANKNAGKVLSIIPRLNGAGIKMNCQLVLCPGYNDGKELERSLGDLLAYQNVECVACVPVGITDHREGLAELHPFEKQTAGETIDIIDRFGDLSLEKYGERRAFAADEFYLLAERKIPEASFYGDFLQLENGVGLWALTRSQAMECLNSYEPCEREPKTITLVTGVAAYPLIKEIAGECEKKQKNLKVYVKQIINNYFGKQITVSGLVTATDIYEQLKSEKPGRQLIIPSSMLRSEGDMFLDSVTVSELSQKLGAEIVAVDCDGYSLVEAILS